MPHRTRAVVALDDDTPGDLLYRIDGLDIHAPSLGERKRSIGLQDESASSSSQARCH